MDELHKSRVFRIADQIMGERFRQVADLRFDAAHDDAHAGGSLAMAAALYAAPEQLFIRRDLVTADAVHFMDPWPWESKADRRTRRHRGGVAPNSELPYADRRRMLIKAAALIVAEIERLDRAESNAGYLVAGEQPLPPRPKPGSIRYVPANEGAAAPSDVEIAAAVRGKPVEVETSVRTETWPVDPAMRPCDTED